jgi:hypothetical protein
MTELNEPVSRPSCAIHPWLSRSASIPLPYEWPVQNNAPQLSTHEQFAEWNGMANGVGLLT